MDEASSFARKHYPAVLGGMLDIDFDALDAKLLEGISVGRRVSL